MMQGLKNRTRKALGLRRKDRDSDATSSPDKEGGGTGKKGSKKANGAPNGFYGEIDWDRYASPDVDEEGFSLRPGDDGTISFLSLTKCSPASKGKHFFSSSDSEDDEDSKRKFKIKIKPLVSDSAKCLPPSMDELKASVGGLALSPSLRRSPRRSPGLMKRNLSCEEIARPRRSTPTAAPEIPIDRLSQNQPTFFGLPPEIKYARYDVVPTDAWGDSRPHSESALSRSFPTGAPPLFLLKTFLLEVTMDIRLNVLLIYQMEEQLVVLHLST
ncbi:hypothetical protein WMY93_000540 [Mugilogobius chulae]|uniref:Uncharacterized protein n=1 Tax=Mugilogobius chulae TaxID=88201 RepID=A0AAW0Q2C3_9GOBI